MTLFAVLMDSGGDKVSRPEILTSVTSNDDRLKEKLILSIIV